MFRLVRHFEVAHPEITVEPREFDFSDPTAGLADGTTEVAIIRPPVDLPDHRMFILDTERLGGMSTRDHRLAQRSELKITELLDEPIVWRPTTAGTWRDYWMAMDARDGTPPTIATVAATYEEETTTIARGLGISFTSEAIARLYDDRASRTCRSGSAAQLHRTRLASGRPQPRRGRTGAPRPRGMELRRR